MISIFNGRKRSLSTSMNEIFAQVSVEMRQYLHLFHNGKNLNPLGVFLAIALHADENGWAWPGRDMLMKETGVATKDAMADALTWLRGMEIDGRPIINQYRILAKGKFFGNAFHIFPDSGGEPPAKLLRLGKLTEWNPSHDQPDTVLPGPDQPDPDDPDCLKENHLKEEPDHSANAGNKPSQPPEVTIPPGTTENRVAQMVWDCTCCGQKNAIHFQDVTAPCCGLTIQWTGNKWLAKKQKHAQGDTRAHIIQHTIRPHPDPAVNYLQQATQARVKANEISEIMRYVNQHDLAAFKAVADKVIAEDKALGKYGRGLIIHVVNSLPGAGNPNKPAVSRPLNSREARLEAEREEALNSP